MWWQRLKQIGTKVLLFAICILLLLSVLVRLLFDSYNTYRRTTIDQSLDYLQVLSNTVAGSLSLYVDGEAEKMASLAGSPPFQRAWKSFAETGDPTELKIHVLNTAHMFTNELCRIYLLDHDGTTLFRLSTQPLLGGPQDDYLLEQAKAHSQNGGTGMVFPLSQHQYALTLQGGVYMADQRLGSVVGVWDLTSLYRRLLAPIHLKTDGYVTVTDQFGTVIMHPAQERIGVNCFEDSAIEEEAFYEETMALRRRQYASAEGSGMYQSRWWQAEEQPLVTQLVGFSRAQVGDYFWVVSVEADARPVQQLSDRNLARLLSFALAILLVLVAGVAAAVQLGRRQLHLEREARRLQEHNRILEELYNSQQELRHRQKLQTLGTFANGIAHEFNNLLTPIIALSDLLREELRSNETLYEDICTIHQSGQKAREIVQQMNRFGRKDIPQEGFELIAVDHLLQDVLRIVRALMLPSVLLHTDFAHDDSLVFGNGAQLQQVLLNFCSNAYQAMEARGGTLTLRSRLVPWEVLPTGYGLKTADRYVVLQVEDTGCGIDAETLERIFDPYFTTKDSGQGTGLGLALAQSTILSHGGAITVRSQVGKGSCFTACLPCAASQGAPARQAAAPAKALQKEARVLVIDDEPEVLHTMARLLRNCGCHAEAYGSSLAALHSFERQPLRYDLVITDYAMPDCNGIELARQIHALRPELPILLVSGLAPRERDHTEQPDLFIDYLTKPLDPDALAEKVSLLQAQPSRKPS